MNQADEDIPFTRIHEPHHFHPEREFKSNKTLIFKEFSKFTTKDQEPFYPAAGPV